MFLTPVHDTVSLNRSYRFSLKSWLEDPRLHDETLPSLPQYDPERLMIVFSQYFGVSEREREGG